MSADSTLSTGKWAIANAMSDEGCAVFRVRTDYPTDKHVQQFTSAIVIRWEYGADEGGMPDSITQQAMDFFEDSLVPLQEDGHAYQMLVTTGFELKEWVYYAKDTDSFMSVLNGLLADKPRFPIDITFLDDPEWSYWRDVIEDINQSADQ